MGIIQVSISLVTTVLLLVWFQGRNHWGHFFMVAWIKCTWIDIKMPMSKKYARFRRISIFRFPVVWHFEIVANQSTSAGFVAKLTQWGVTFWILWVAKKWRKPTETVHFFSRATTQTKKTKVHLCSHKTSTKWPLLINFHSFLQTTVHKLKNHLISSLSSIL